LGRIASTTNALLIKNLFGVISVVAQPQEQVLWKEIGMQGFFDSHRRNRRGGIGVPRLVRLPVSESGTAELWYGCPVTSANGDQLGTVDHMLIDWRTRQVRYVVLAHGRNSAEIALPWAALYFDAALAQLVFYTLDP
jgi:PRC-barrel domain